MRGRSGQGKSTLAREILKGLTPYVRGHIVSTDTIWMVETFGFETYAFVPEQLRLAHEINRAKVEALMKGEHCEKSHLIIVDNTNTTWKEILPYVELAKKYKYEVEVKEPQTPWKNDVKELAGRNVHHVPLEVIEKQDARFEDTVDIEKKIKEYING